MSSKAVRSAPLLCAAVLVVLVASCDSTAPNDLLEQVFIEGTVTTAAGHKSNWRDPLLGVHGAHVTASAVEASGSTRPLLGETRSDVNARYFLTTSATANPLLLTAAGAGPHRAALLEEGAAAGPVPGGVLVAPPMTLESTAEAEIFLRARRHEPRVGVADVSALVGERIAEAIQEGRIGVDEVARTLAESVAAQLAFAERVSGASSPEAHAGAAAARREAYAVFRTTISRAESSLARSLAVDAFVEQYADAWARAGLPLWQQGRATLVSYGLLRHGQHGAGAAGFALYQRALLVAATNLSVGVIHEFALSGSGAGTIGTLSLARMDLFAALQEADSAHRVAVALDAYRASVFQELGVLLDVPAAVIDTTWLAVMPHRESLLAAVAHETDSRTIAAIYSAFFAAVGAAVQAELGAAVAPAVISALAAL